MCNRRVYSKSQKGHGIASRDQCRTWCAKEGGVCPADESDEQVKGVRLIQTDINTYINEHRDKKLLCSQGLAGTHSDGHAQRGDGR